eukprot:TRINITY_DN8888_c0_g2_i2.p1 TRINITY_DN8888_c0_g2~~TRINITY_DN8888_c0_g2_i2.p1  ORF type:complete len:132 (-),score=22.72 TRINITY_DN8888_c0_g2_i2:246-641(-)
MDLDEFLRVLVPLLKGSPREQFDLCYSLLFNKEELITPADLSFVCSIWYRITNVGLISIEEATIKIKNFIYKLFYRVNHHMEANGDKSMDCDETNVSPHSSDHAPLSYSQIEKYISDICIFWNTLTHSTYL